MVNNNHVGIEEHRAYWSMVLPAFSIYLFVMAFPIVISIILSLSDYNGGRMFGGEAWRITGFGQYRKLVSDPYFWLALKNNIYIVVISVFGQLPLGFLIAYIIYRKMVRCGGFWQGVLYVPAIIPVIVIGILWGIVFSPYGPLAELMNSIYAHGFEDRLNSIFAGNYNTVITDGLVYRILDICGTSAKEIFSNPLVELKEFLMGYSPSETTVMKNDLVNLLAPTWNADFLNKRDIAMLPILFVTLWCWTGTYLILFLANMQKIDPQILEAAQIDGASEGQIVSRIILPSLSGVIMNAAILCISGSLNAFALIQSMTAGGPARITQVLSIYMYESAFMGAPDYPYANAISLFIVMFSFILIVLTRKIENKWGGKE
ncbi:MAG: carbohydrate ABC transporter permease [Sphaerochaetaceae bacterium]